MNYDTSRSYGPIPVVEGNREMLFVQTPYGIVFFLRHHKARRGYCANVLRDVRLPEIPGLVSRREPVRMACGFTDADYHSGMLNGAVFIEQLRAHSTHVRS